MTHRSVRLSTGKAHIYAVTGLLVVAALLAGGYAWVTRTSPSQPGTPLERVTIAANTTYAGTGGSDFSLLPEEAVDGTI